ncbi:Glucose-methanol-choline oxidoreductase [Gracilaria domingensis]|nr:Glucose-methanol-choline oxidoreductase [Gracilaria domingensis]
MLILLRCASALPDTDVLIVGAGTSGCALAARLCASLPDMHITLLERAQPRSEASDFTVRTPRSSFDTLGDPNLVELMQSEPEPSLANRVLSIATGATLGGSSSVNGMQFFSPLFGDVRRWKVRGLTEFNVAKYILRALNQLGAASQQGEFRQIYVDNLLNAANRAGFAADRGPLDRRVANTIFENRVAVNASGVRQDSCTAYLTPVENSVCANNFRLVQGITVTRVLFKPRRWYSRKLDAYGAEYVFSNDTEAKNRMSIRARRRIILAAGPFGSPKLLQLSGIGPRSVLNQANVTLLKRLGVGTQAQARALLGTLASYDDQLPLEPIANDAVALSAESIARWRSGNGGLLRGVVFGACTIPPSGGGEQPATAGAVLSDQSVVVRVAAGARPQPVQRAQSTAGRAGAARREAAGEAVRAAHGRHPPRIRARVWAAPRGAARRRGHARVHRADGGVCVPPRRRLRRGARARRPAARPGHHAPFRGRRLIAAQNDLLVRPAGLRVHAGRVRR